MRQPVFIDPLLQQKFDRDGIIRTSLLSVEQVAQIREIFERLHPARNEQMEQGYYFSTFAFDEKYRTTITTELGKVLRPELDKIFTNYKVLFSIFQVKGIGENSVIHPHQDLTVVDEEKYYSCTCWIPLIDSDDNNGGIRALLGSQNVFRSFRTHTTGNPFTEALDFISDNAVSYPAKAGEALVFDSGNIHFSPPNTSGTPRVSVAVSIVSKDAPVTIGFFNRENDPTNIELYKVPEDFWQQYKDFPKEREQRPAFGEFAGKKEIPPVVEIPREEFIQKYLSWKKANISTQILKDAYLQQKLEEQGFLQIPFLSDEQVNKLQEIFDALHRGNAAVPFDRLFTCMHNPDPAYRQNMHQQIAEIIEPVIRGVFSDFQYTTFTFQIKGIGKDSELPVHQDWSLTDERFYSTYTFWISLMDCYPENGTLYVLPGSHKYLKMPRGPGMQPVFREVEEEVRKMMRPLYIKAGELILFDGAMAHYSPANFTDKIRVSVMTNITHKDAQFQLFFGRELGDDKVEMTAYEVPNDLYQRYTNYREQFESPPPFARFKSRFVQRSSYAKDNMVARLPKKSILSRLYDRIMT